MSKTIFIVHGSFGSPDENWIPWLKKQLVEKGYEVVVPTFPTPEKQSLDNWMEAFLPYKEKVTSESIFVAHSIGPAFVIDMLSEWNLNVAKCCFVAGFYTLLNNEVVDPVNKTFFVDNFDWNKIKGLVGEASCFYSDNDPYVPQLVAEWLADRLNAKKVLISGGKHLNAGAGFTQFPELLEEIIK